MIAIFKLSNFFIIFVSKKNDYHFWNCTRWRCPVCMMLCLLA